MANTLPPPGHLAIDSPNVRSLTGNGLLLFWKPTNDNAACNSNLNAMNSYRSQTSEGKFQLAFSARRLLLNSVKEKYIM